MQVGKEVNADVVIRVDVSKMSLYDGKTMYRGVSDVEVELIDVKTKEVLFAKSFPSFTYPETAAISTTEMELQKFRKMYVMMIGERVSRLFVSHQMGADIAGDARILEFQ